MTAQSLEMQLLEAVETELKDVITNRGTVQRRMMPLVEREDIIKLQVTVYLDGGDHKITSRRVDHETIQVWVAIQKAVPHPESNERGVTVFDGVDNLVFADEMLLLARELRSLWGPAGELRDKVLAGCVFRELEQDQILEPMHLLEKGVVSIVFSTTYGRTTHEED